VCIIDLAIDKQGIEGNLLEPYVVEGHLNWEGTMGSQGRASSWVQRQSPWWGFVGKPPETGDTFL